MMITLGGAEYRHGAGGEHQLHQDGVRRWRWQTGTEGDSMTVLSLESLERRDCPATLDVSGGQLEHGDAGLRPIELR